MAIKREEIRLAILKSSISLQNFISFDYTAVSSILLESWRIIMENISSYIRTVLGGDLIFLLTISDLYLLQFYVPDLYEKCTSFCLAKVLDDRLGCCSSHEYHKFQN